MKSKMMKSTLNEKKKKRHKIRQRVGLHKRYRNVRIKNNFRNADGHRVKVAPTGSPPARYDEQALTFSRDADRRRC